MPINISKDLVITLLGRNTFSTTLQTNNTSVSPLKCKSEGNSYKSKNLDTITVATFDLSISLGSISGI